MIEKIDIKDYENKEQLVWFGVINKINDLSDKIGKLETELERTRKALETLQEFITKLYLNGNITDEQLERYKKMLTTALEQKEG